MRRHHTSRSRAPFYLLVLCIGLASIVYWQVEHPPSFPSGVAGTDQPAEPEPTRALQAEFTFPPLAAFSEIVARPLFSPARQPPTKKEEFVVDEVSPPTLSHFILAGVVISSEGQLVLLRRTSTTEVVRALLGQEIDGWQVERIESDRVTLRHGDTVEVITLQEKVEYLPDQLRLRVREYEQLGENEAQQ